MTSTSLKEQLKKLEAPQTVALLDTREKPSLLFDAGEAAKKDRRTIYELGKAGLHELIAINTYFLQFEYTLFDETTIDLERAVEQSEVNRLLDANIAKFLQHLSPYLLLRPAHMCLEWLLRRFHIHRYNTDDLLALALPYHETNVFVRVIQTIPMRKLDSWLHAVKKTGLTLPKSSIFNRAASERNFLNFVCTHTLKTVQELKQQANLLQTLLNFYATTVVGALEKATKVQEWHITTILPSLLKGFSSEVPDVVSASFMITAQLVARTQLTSKLGNAFVKRVANVGVEILRPAAILLLSWIFESQQCTPPIKFTEETLLMLVRQKWLTQLMGTYVNDNVSMISLCVPLLKQSVDAIQSAHENYTDFQIFLQRFLFDVKLNMHDAQRFISTYLDALNIDMDMVDVEFQEWYKDYLQQLEHQYPDAFDLAVKDALGNNADDDTEQRSTAVKMALGFRLKSFDKNDTDVYESLYHPTAKIRFFAVKTLLKNFKDCRDKNKNFDTLRQCLVDRVHDDSEAVVSEVLKLPTVQFIQILGHAKFVHTLHNILLKYQVQNDEHWSALLPQVVQHLVSEEIIENYDSNLLLLAIMPILLPNFWQKATHAQCLEQLSQSALCKKIKLLNEFKNLRASETATKGHSLKQQLLDILSKSRETPDAASLHASVQELLQQNPNYFQVPLNFAHYLLLMTASFDKTLQPEHSLSIFKHMLDISKNFQLKHVDQQYWQQPEDMAHVVPLQLYCDFLVSVARNTQFGDLSEAEWAKEGMALQCFMQLYSHVVDKLLEQQKPNISKTIWTQTLQELVETVLPSLDEKFSFLLNFYTYDNIQCVPNYDILRVMSFKLLQAVLQSKNLNNSKINIKLLHILKINVALQAKSQTIRAMALDTLTLIHDLSDELHMTDNLLLFVQLMLKKFEEIKMDEEQYALILYIILKGDTTKSKMLNILHETVELCAKLSLESSAVFIAKTLQSMRHIDDKTILLQLIPLARRALSCQVVENDVKLLKQPYAKIYQLICARLNKEHLSSLLENHASEAWFFAEAFSYHDTYFVDDAGINAKLMPLPCAVLAVFDSELYDSLNKKYKYEFIKLIIATEAAANNDVIFLAAFKLLKKCELNSVAFVDILQQMFNTPQLAKQNGLGHSQSKDVRVDMPMLGLESKQWKEGMVLLELLENHKRLVGVHEILPTLFELLRICLLADAGEGALEYTKQLTLGALLNCCIKSKADKLDLQKLLPESSFRVDQVVQCVRTTKNPQTQHNALLLLTHCADLFPQQVLNNIMEIFTFMGNSIVRNDDAFSFKIICQIIETVIPILLQSTAAHKHKTSTQTAEVTVIPMLKMFVYILLDVPEHRRLPLYSKLLETLGVNDYLWMFLCIVFEKQANSEDNKKRPHAEKDNILSKYMEICMTLVISFPSTTILETCLQLMRYVRFLPSQAADMPASDCGNLQKADQAEKTLFDLKGHTPKQLRHFKYVIMQFVSTVTSAPDFLKRISQLLPADLCNLKPYYQNLIIQTLTFVPQVNVAIEQSEESVVIKFWKVILHHLHDILDNVISLLSADMFIVVVNGLLQHQLPSIRRKVLELLIGKLQHAETFLPSCETKNLQILLQSLCDNVTTILEATQQVDTMKESSTNYHELAYIQQATLIALRMLSRRLAGTFLADFKNLLVQLIKLLKERKQLSKVLPGALYLTTIEIAANLKAHSLPQLPKFMPIIVEMLQEQAEHLLKHIAPEHMTVAVVSGLQKLFESLSLFLGPYLVNIMTILSTIETRLATRVVDNTQAMQVVTQKLTQIWSKMATEVPMRILLPNCEKAYKKLMTNKYYAEVPILMKMLRENIVHTKSPDLTALQTDLSNFFLQALQFRLNLHESTLTCEQINDYESPIIDALVAWVLKLSESYFRLFYQRIHKWAFKEAAQPEAMLTYFLVTHKIADALKSLFVLFANDFIEDAVIILKDHGNNDIAAQLLQAIINVLANIFLYDSKAFINAHRFDALMQPLVEQFEEDLLLKNEPMQQLLTNCLCQLAIVAPTDVHRKELTYQVLMKTRSNNSQTQIWAFNSCVEIARNLGEEFRSLLPEAIPFIAELFEDDDAEVEKAVRKSVQHLEIILGESLQKYL